MRYAAGLAAILLSSVIAVGAAAARDHGGGGRSHPRFIVPHRHFAHPFPFRSFFFFGAPVFAPLPVALFAGQAYPAYFVAPIDGWPNCYEYQTTAIIGGVPQPVFGTACLGPDGLWHTY
jgi:hypothetical protein